MKRILLIFASIFIVTQSIKIVEASDITREFESIQVMSGRLIKDYSSNELETFYKKTYSRKFNGYNSYTINNYGRASFVDATIFEYFNNGSSTVSLSQSTEEKVVRKSSFSIDGSLKAKGSGGKNVKGSFESSLSAGYSLSTDEYKITKRSFNFNLDPGYRFKIKSIGTGTFANGVSSKYLFYKRVGKGTFEEFTISSLYYKMEITR